MTQQYPATETRRNKASLPEARAPRLIRSRSGTEINVAESCWQVSADHNVDVSIFGFHLVIDEGIRAFLEHHLRVNSASYVASQRTMLRPLAETDIQAAVHRSMEDLGYLDRSVLEAFTKAVDRTVSSIFGRTT